MVWRRRSGFGSRPSAWWRCAGDERELHMVSYSARILGMGDGVDHEWRAQAIQRRDNRSVADIEGTKPKKQYVRERVPEHHRLPDVRTGGDAPDMGNAQIRAARAVHAYSRQNVPRQPEIPGNHPRRVILADFNRNGLVNYDEPIPGTKPNPNFRGHDETVFNAKRVVPLDPQEPVYNPLGQTQSCLPYDRNQHEAPPRMAAEPRKPKFGRRAMPPAESRADIERREVKGSQPRRHFNAAPVPIETRDIMKNDDVAGATTWNWKPLHRRFVGGSHAPRALHAEQQAPKLGPTTGLATQYHDVSQETLGGENAKLYGQMITENGLNNTAGRPGIQRRGEYHGPRSVNEIGAPGDGAVRFSK